MKGIIVCAGRLFQGAVNKLASVDGLTALPLRLYLVPIFWMAGTHKLNGFDSTVEWFGNAEWGLGLPFPWLMAFLAMSSELVGSVFLLIGFATRFVCIPLMVTMAVAAATVHWENGWQAIADPSAPFANERVLAAPDKLERARSILQEHGNYEWLTASGKFVILNNGIEFAATYFVMLLALLFMGGGRFVSVDYWIARLIRRFA